MKTQRYGLPRIINATRFSIQGLCYAWKNESAFREEVIIGFLLIITALFIGENHVEKVLLISSCFFVLIVELINSAIEAVVDRVGTEHHTLAGAAKDLGSAAVMLSLGVLIITWGLLLTN